MSFSSDQPQITNQLPQTINLPSIKERPELFAERVEDLLRQIANSLNSKSGGLKSLAETGASKQFYKQDNPQKFRNVYNKVLNFVDLNGAPIGASASVNFAHVIMGLQQSAGIYAHCTDSAGKRFTVAYPSVYADNTNAYFTNPVALTLSQCDIELNYLKET